MCKARLSLLALGRPDTMAWLLCLHLPGIICGGMSELSPCVATLNQCGMGTGEECLPLPSLRESDVIQRSISRGPLVCGGGGLGDGSETSP